MLKFMYFARRKPSWTADTFPARWRQHGNLAISQKSWPDNMMLYIQADAVYPRPLDGLAGDFDGFSYVLARDEQQFFNPTDEQKAMTKTLLQDEFETFEAPIPPVLMFVREEVLKAGPPGGVTACLAFDDAAKAEGVARAYAQKPGARRVVLNRVRPDLKMADLKITYNATVEVAADDAEQLTGILGSGADAPWRSADGGVVAREHILWDQMAKATATA